MENSTRRHANKTNVGEFEASQHDTTAHFKAGTFEDILMSCFALELLPKEVNTLPAVTPVWVAI
jgi:hypothetical protein